MLRRLRSVAVATLGAIAFGAVVLAYLETRQELDQARASLVQARVQLQEERERLREKEQRLTEASAFLSETAGMTARICRWPMTKRVRVSILKPGEGRVVDSPVLVHLQIVRPVGCDATYHVTVDGIPYAPLGMAGGTPPFTATNPEGTRRLGKGQWEQACRSGTFAWLSLQVPRGMHTLRIDGCPQGTAVPQTIPTEVSFRVR